MKYQTYYMYEKLEIGEQTVVDYFKILFNIYMGEYNENPQYEQTENWPATEPRSFRIQSRNANTTLQSSVRDKLLALN
jgi:hypothetical protein